MSAGFASRDDRFSQLLSKLLQDEFSMGGQALISRSGLSPEEFAELTSLAEAASEAFREEMADAISRLRELLAQGDPLYTLSVVQMTNVMGAAGSYYEPTHVGMESKVELVAGLLLSQECPTDADPVADDVLRSIYEELDHVLEVSLLRNLSAAKGEDQTTAELRFTSAMSWMTLRGTSFAHHGTELAAAVYRPFDNWCHDRYGFTFDDVLNVGTAAEALITDRLNLLLDEARVFGERVREYAASAAAQEKFAAEGIPDADDRQTHEFMAERAFIHVLRGGMRDAMSFTPSDLASRGLPEDRVTAVLKELSLSACSVSPGSYTGPFDKSPLVEHPFFEFDGRFNLAVPGMVLRDALVLLENRFINGPSTFSKARAKTLDRLAVEYLEALLPGSNGFTNLSYEDSELDGLVLFERTAFVVEGKGSALSVQAQRGDIRRLASDIRDAVEDAWNQGARARDYLRSGEDAVFCDERGTEVLRIPAGSIDEIFIVNPTLHQLAGHASQLPRLKALGLFPDGEFPWSIFINDLRVIAETADNAAVFLHYLSWRARLPLGGRISVSDELDLWGSYLLCERFGTLAGEGHAVVGNSSTDFDAYYAGIVGDGPERPKPGKFLEEPVRGFIERMARERPAGWREASAACLELSIPELALVVGKARRIWKEANAADAPSVLECGRVLLVGVPRSHDLAEVIGSTEQRESGATFHIYVKGSKAKGGELVWATCVKPVDFALSDFEAAAFEALESDEGPL
jgi:hypothetical protein